MSGTSEPKELKLIVDLFAGGGGASTGIFLATGRHPDIAINHNDDALSMHRANHPDTRHFIADVFEVCPKDATQGKPVGWLHLSPDCTHHSQAAGGQPRSKRLRGLAWVGLRWAGQVSPDIISLENVSQILKWGPLIAKRDRVTGRVITLDVVLCPTSGKMINRVAEPGEQVPIQQQYLIPDRRRVGQTWQRFCSELRALGYKVEDTPLCAADLGVPTTRERLFMMARRDGQEIEWPEQTHFKTPGKGQSKWRSAATCIDFSIPINSIFGRKKPLADATMRRLAKGLQRYVVECANPFIVPIAHYNGSVVAHSTDEPLRTITSATKGGEFALGLPKTVKLTPFVAKFRGNNAGTRIDLPVPTITSGGESARPAGSPHALGLTAPVLIQIANGDGKPGGFVECVLTPEQHEGAQKVAAFLMRYYSEGGQLSNIADPMATITTKDRMALVTVTISGQPHVIVDIGLRMLQPSELFMAQGFPKDYKIKQGHDGRKFTKSTQVKLCGNSVPPGFMEALFRANYPQLTEILEQDAA